MNKADSKNLKEGDAVVIHATIGAINKDDNSMACLKITPEPNHNIYYCVPIEFLHVATPAPKYDPCRLFKKGDRVREVRCRGRRFMEDSPESLLTEGGVIANDEGSLHYIEVVTPDGQYNPFDPAYLELVTPVEELEPYSIDTRTTTDILKHGEWYAHMSDGDEAEHLCQWLNEKHRKENN